MSGIFAGGSVLGGALPSRGDGQSVYLGAASDTQLADDDTNTMAAAMTQAKATGKNVTVSLSDGSTYTATPHDLDASTGKKTALIAGGVVIGLGALAALWRVLRRPKKNPRRRRARRR